MSRNSQAQSRSQTGAPRASVFAIVAALFIAANPHAHAILAGGETGLPADSPANRIDLLGVASPFNAVGALAISSGGFSYRGSGTAISPHWVLTAGHNLDLNDNGAPDVGLNISFNLPGFGEFIASGFYTAPSFTGFGNPSIQRDLGLLYFATPLPVGIWFPSLQGSLQTGSQVALAGFGRSGFGDYGYTTSASLTDRRIGFNVIDTFELDDRGGGFPAVFRYDFDAPVTIGLPGGSLGNNLETIIGPGDSGGPLLLENGNGYSLVGVNTFIEGYGGRFGDIGGGIVLAPYLDWISQTTGVSVPEPSAVALLLLSGGFLFYRGPGFLLRQTT